MINLTDKLYLKADKNCYMVFERAQRGEKGGELDKGKNPKYYTTLTSALRGAVSDSMREEVMNETVTTLEEFLVSYSAITQNFEGSISAIEI